MNPLVSICIPAYRNPEMLKRCIQSVLMQTYTHYELIITDDSPDHEIELLVKNLLKDKPFQYYRNAPALGSPENWNRAIFHAQGAYIKLLHHDDWFAGSDSLEQFMNAALKSGASFLFCNSGVVTSSADGNYVHAAGAKQVKRLLTDPGFLFFRNIIGAPSATLYKRDTVFKYNPAFKWLVDVEFYIRYLTKHRSVHHIAIPLVNTFNGAEGQITQAVVNDAKIVLKENLLLFSTLYPGSIRSKKVAYFLKSFLPNLELKPTRNLKIWLAFLLILTPFYMTFLKPRMKTAG